MLLPSHHRQNGDVAAKADGRRGQSLTRPLTDHDSHDDFDAGASIPPHPLGIKPLGNKFFFDGDDARDCIGTLQALPDEMLMQLLEFLDPRTLRLLGYTCRFLFACCMSDDIWRTIFLE